ncbi:MAG: 1,4-alpha-glucan branching protein domain-containing protein [Candidatus Riflebacteria bacterium]
MLDNFCRPGFLMLVLHAHLPFVRHPEHDDMMEERWLFEAITETYIPLLQMLSDFHEQGIVARFSMSITPPLANMLADELLSQRYLVHLKKLLSLAEKEMKRTLLVPALNATARLYLQKFQNSILTFERWQHNLIRAFSFFQQQGLLEIFTCCATHGYLPLMQQHPESVSAQIEMAVIDYKRHFGCQPGGIWLAECAFNPGNDEILKRFGLKYFFVDTHGVLYADPRPTCGVYAPIKCPSGVFAFGRDVESSRQVWSAHEGYPGDFNYREFYRDIGFDLDKDSLHPFMHETGVRLNTGIKYHRITSRAPGEKDYYNYHKAMEIVASHVAHFIESREKQIRHVAGSIGQPPVVVAPYDAELFGHWWYEGPEFLALLLRKIAMESSIIGLATPADFLRQFPEHQVAMPSQSSWGHRGYNEFWLNKSNDWIYPHQDAASERMAELCRRFPEASGLQKRALNQAARELMLLQSSDWAFIIRNNTTVEYATRRVKDHTFRFTRLYEDLLRNSISESWLREVEKRDNIFPQMDYRIYRPDRFNDR